MVFANHADEDDEHKEDRGGDEEDCPIMDCTVSTATAATLALQARRSLGRPLRWMEQVKMERLRQVNRDVSRHLSPTPPPKSQSLPGLTGNSHLYIHL